MTIGSDVPQTTITRGQQNLFALATGLTFLLVIMGGTVCVTGSTLGCPDWPGCYGRLVPPPRADSIIEYSHRLLALLAAPLVLAAAILGWRRTRSLRWVSRPPLAAFGLFVVVSIFGAFAVLTGLRPSLAALDLGFALLALALMVAATEVARARRRIPELADRLSFEAPFSRLALGTFAAVFLVLVMGVLVAAPNSIARCLGWPLFGGEELAATSRDWVQGMRIALAGVAGMGILGLVAGAWRSERRRQPVFRVALAVALLFAGELTLGRWLVTAGPSAVLLTGYVALAVGLWAALAALVVRAALPAMAQKTAEGFS